MNRRVMLAGLAVGILIVLIGANIFISDAAIPDNVAANPVDTLNAIKTSIISTAGAMRTSLDGTVTALHADLGGTVTAFQSDLGSTVSAIHTDLGGTVTAFRSDLSGTVTALGNTVGNYRSLGGTLTAVGPTLNAWRTDIPATITALGMTVTAIRPELIGTATAFESTVQAVKSTLALTPVSADVATQTIIDYAVNTFAIPVTVVKAGGTDANIVKAFPVPTSVLFAQSLATLISPQAYVAQLSNGVAWVNTGIGTVSATGIRANIQNASLGVYALTVQKTGALDAASALALAKATYPGLSNETYTASTSSNGFSWSSFGIASVIDPATRQFTVTPQKVILSVVPGTDGTATVSIAVGRGTFAIALGP